MTSASADLPVAVIGGGPAGLMAAIGAARQGIQTVLLEKGDRLGRKLLISGGGRCNVTNARGTAHIIENIPGNGRFLYSSLAKWSSDDIISFFTLLGVPLKEEDRGRMFPVTDKAMTVLNALQRELSSLAVDVRLRSTVSALDFEEDTGAYRIALHGESDTAVRAGAVVVAAGGCAAPETGSTGDGYVFAQRFGHTLVPPYPTSVPLVSNDALIVERHLQGLSLRGVALTLYDPRGKVATREEGDVIFTHFGLSGPAALRVSQYAVKLLQKNPGAQLKLAIDTMPAVARDQFLDNVRQWVEKHPRRGFRTVLKDVVGESRGSQASAGHAARIAMQDAVPERLIETAWRKLGFAADQIAADVSKKQVEALYEFLKHFPMNISGTLGMNRATVTGGGVSLKGIDPRTMGSKLAAGLFFAGEIMDVHAHTGGYNITVAFSTGYVAGTAAADYVRVRKAGTVCPTRFS